jgi:hypothetical protein
MARSRDAPPERPEIRLQSDPTHAAIDARCRAMTLRARQGQAACGGGLSAALTRARAAAWVLVCDDVIERFFLLTEESRYARLGRLTRCCSRLARRPDITMELPGAVVVLPHDDVLALVSHDVGCREKSVSPNFDRRIAVAFNLNRF